MKKILLLAACVMNLGLHKAYCGTDQPSSGMTFTEGLKFCEGTVPYRNMILVSNFGGYELNPMNTAGKGYIMAIDGDKAHNFIPSDGLLSAPKGMCIHGNRLFIADVNKVVVYNLRSLKEKPITIQFPEGDDFVNDIVAVSDIILVSVTNTGRLYGIDASNPERLAETRPQFMGNVPGANGMVVNGNMLYIASYNPSGTPTQQNIIYAYDLSSPNGEIVPLSEDVQPGQYDGIAISEDLQTLYFTSWAAGDTPSTVYVYDIAKKQPIKTINFGIPFNGPADISIKGGYLWVPDLPESKVYRIPL